MVSWSFRFNFSSSMITFNVVPVNHIFIILPLARSDPGQFHNHPQWDESNCDIIFKASIRDMATDDESDRWRWKLLSNFNQVQVYQWRILIVANCCYVYVVLYYVVFLMRKNETMEILHGKFFRFASASEQWTKKKIVSSCEIIKAGNWDHHRAPATFYLLNSLISQ